MVIHNITSFFFLIIGCTPRMRANSILGLSDSNEKVSEKNISYVKPCVIKPPEVTGL